VNINYRKISEGYENELEKYQTGSRAVGWPRQEDVAKRFKVILDIIKFDTMKSDHQVSIVDIGCGLGHLLEFINEQAITSIEYSGLDISLKYIDRCKNIFPDHDFFCCDLLTEEFNKKFDFAVMNGLFTQKFSMEQDDMFTFLKLILKKVFPLVHRGLAFNVMSPYVDFKKDGAFHLEINQLSEFIITNLSRNFVIRHDYGLYEYTCYIYKDNQ
jgi:SAM-dependent methyltransferase